MSTKLVSYEEKYHFDTLGYLLIKNVLNEKEIDKLKQSFINIKKNNQFDSIYLKKKEMIPDDVNHASRVFIDDQSHVGSVIKAVIYELDTTATDGLVFLNESDNYVLQGNDLGSWIDIPFVNPISLLNGFAYEFGVAGYMDPNDTSWVGVSGSMMYAGEHSSFDELIYKINTLD